MAYPHAFKIKDKVKTAAGTRNGGVVAYIACIQATQAGGKTCDRKTCQHPDDQRTIVWVLWQGTKTTMSYHHAELAFDKETIKEDTTLPEPGDSVYTSAPNIDSMKKVITDEEKKRAEAFRIYAGFDKVKFDKNGKPYLKEIIVEDKVPIKNEDINWQVYNGFERGSVKKQS